tara:strand:+ start:90 stop:689 length:600 start_codon:yes stop_codon:yes gene_type:complete
MNDNTKYTNVAIALHWLIGIAILFMFILGWFMTELPKESAKTTSFDIFNLGLMTWEVAKEESPRAFYFNLHKSIGLTILMLIVLRMYWRFTHRPPAFLNSMKLWEKRLAKATHHSLYLLMFLIPLSGIIMSAGSKYGIKWFGIKVIPGFDDKAIRELFFEFHEIFGLLLLLLLIFHILGAIKHSIIDKDGTLRRMWFSK